MKKFRQLIFWLHLCAGVIAGVVVLVMSATGVLLAFERQINQWADGHRVQRPASQAQHLPVETLLANLHGPAPATMTLRSDPGAPAEAGYGRERIVLLDPYTGAVLGEASRSSREFFEVVERWHRFFGAQGDNRPVGRMVTGASNLAFLFLVTTGPFLWWPKQWTWSRLKPVLLFRGNVAGRAREWNWHNVFGIWSAAPLFLIVLSGVIMSYPWANNLLYRITGNEPPVQRGPGGPPRNGEARRSDPAALNGINDYWLQAEQKQPGWTSIALRIPNSPQAPLAFSIDAGSGGQPQKRSTLTFSRRNGEVQWETFASSNLGRQLRVLARFTHTGEAAGILGQVIACLASLGAVVLVYTGIVLVFRRLYRWRSRKNDSKKVTEPALDVQLT